MFCRFQNRLQVNVPVGHKAQHVLIVGVLFQSVALHKAGKFCGFALRQKFIIPRLRVFRLLFQNGVRRVFRFVKLSVFHLDLRKFQKRRHRCRASGFEWGGGAHVFQLFHLFRLLAREFFHLLALLFLQPFYLRPLFLFQSCNLIHGLDDVFHHLRKPLHQFDIRIDALIAFQFGRQAFGTETVDKYGYNTFFLVALIERKISRPLVFQPLRLDIFRFGAHQKHYLCGVQSAVNVRLVFAGGQRLQRAFAEKDIVILNEFVIDILRDFVIFRLARSRRIGAFEADENVVRVGRYRNAVVKLFCRGNFFAFRFVGIFFHVRDRGVKGFYLFKVYGILNAYVGNPVKGGKFHPLSVFFEQNLLFA